MPGLHGKKEGGEQLMAAQEPIQLKRGDRIRLNAKAREWTREKVFFVEEVRGWGVICWAQVKEGEAVVIRDSDVAFYRAAWDEIAMRIEGMA
jgi:hypothetical protein